MEEYVSKVRSGFVKRVFATVGVLSILLAIAWWVLWPRSLPRPDYRPHIAELRGEEVFVYPPGQSPLRGTIVFFGNDVGFWQPHQRLADFLSRQGYAVVGFDLRKLLKSSPNAPQSERDAMIGDSLGRLMAESLTEFHGEKLPLLLMGHSLGAEVAVWAAAHIAQPRVTGIVALAPGGRGHLAITAADFLSSAVPTGPESFSVAELVKALPAGVRVALVRGAYDGYRGADPEIVAAGRERLQKFTIPFAGHALKKILLARYVVRSAIEWVALGGTRGSGGGD